MTMPFATDFATYFSNFRVDLESDKYLSNTFDPILLMWHDEAPGLKVENEDEENIENLGSCFPLSKKGLQYPLSIFNRHNSRL